jgi:CobQ-like glutamine amidotransferase family enzyme
MITLMQLYPRHLDLNGDGGNILVLERRIQWGGLQSRTVILEPGDKPVSRPDVLVIGHGTTAAWREIYSDFARLVPTISEWIQQGTQVLAISSGFAALHGLLDGLPLSIGKKTRVSKFEVAELDGKEVFGYLNSDLELETISRHGNLIGSLLHGPLLAKNTWLADEIVEQARGNTARLDVNSSKLDEVEVLAEAARSLAFEQSKG